MPRRLASAQAEARPWCCSGGAGRRARPLCQRAAAARGGRRARVVNPRMPAVPVCSVAPSAILGDFAPCGRCMSLVSLLCREVCWCHDYANGGPLAGRSSVDQLDIRCALPRGWWVTGPRLKLPQQGVGCAANCHALPRAGRVPRRALRAARGRGGARRGARRRGHGPDLHARAGDRRRHLPGQPGALPRCAPCSGFSACSKAAGGRA